MSIKRDSVTDKEDLFLLQVKIPPEADVTDK
jgi:hypothetical protein